MKMVEVEIHGVSLLVPEHRSVEVDWETWEMERLAAMRDDISEGDIVFDVGAEQGDITGFLAKLAGPTGNACPFEPSSQVWPNIKAIFEANNLPTPLTYWVGFLANEDDFDPPGKDVDTENCDGWPRQAYGDISDVHGFRHISDEVGVVARTPKKKLDTVMEEGVVPDLITMDVEGAELEVLKGAEQLLRTHSPVVYVSIHPAFIEEMYGCTENDVLDWMDHLGYEGKFLASDHEEHWRFSK